MLSLVQINQAPKTLVFKTTGIIGLFTFLPNVNYVLAIPEPIICCRDDGYFTVNIDLGI